MEKKRDREQGGILGGVAELFDLPVDVVAGLPRLELIGNRQLYLERHTGLLAYSDTQIDANTGFGVLRIRGERLTLVAMTGERAGEAPFSTVPLIRSWPGATASPTETAALPENTSMRSTCPATAAFIFPTCSVSVISGFSTPSVSWI